MVCSHRDEEPALEANGRKDLSSQRSSCNSRAASLLWSQDSSFSLYPTTLWGSPEEMRLTVAKDTGRTEAPGPHACFYAFSFIMHILLLYKAVFEEMSLFLKQFENC